MRIYYNVSTVTGYYTLDDGKTTFTYLKEILHRKEQDPIVLAARRNRNIAKSQTVTVETRPAFCRIVYLEPQRRREDIQRQESRGEFEFEGF